MVTAGVTRIGNRSVTFTHRMRNAETGELCASMTGTEVFFDPDTRKSAPIPDAVRERLNAVLVDSADESSGPRSRPTGEGPPTSSWHVTHRGLVLPWRCDHYGHMNARWYAHHFDDAGFHLFNMAGVDVAGLQANDIALVTAQSELNYIKEMVPGTLFAIRSGFSHVGTKSARHLHRLYDAETNQLHATMESTDVAFDMQSRKAVAIPDGARESLLANRVDPNAD